MTLVYDSSSRPIPRGPGRLKDGVHSTSTEAVLEADGVRVRPLCRPRGRT
ncbi:hypothetical protein [Rubrivirga sp.]